MALKATIYKATVNVADLDRNQFLDASLTLAPSFRNPERMMLRLLAWLNMPMNVCNLPVVCVPMMSRKRGCATIIWVLICGLSWGCRMSDGLRKPAPRAAEVALFAYNSRAAQIWWQQNQSKCAQFANLSLVSGRRRAAGESERLCRSYHDAAGNDSGWCYLVIG